MIITKKQIRANFRKAVFKRDGYKCRGCGKPGYDRQDIPIKGEVPLDAHHIQNRNVFLFEGYVVENGISVCSDCHKKAEKYHITQGEEWEHGFHLDDLYVLIGSSLEIAIKADEKAGLI